MAALVRDDVPVVSVRVVAVVGAESASVELPPVFHVAIQLGAPLGNTPNVIKQVDDPVFVPHVTVPLPKLPAIDGLAPQTDTVSSVPVVFSHPLNVEVAA